MRKTLPALLVVSLTPALLVLPVVTPSRPSPHPVAPHIVSLPLAGVNSSALASLQTAQGTQGSASARTTTIRPAVLTAPLPTATYSLVGLTWDQSASAAGLAASVRIKPRGKAWGPWEPLSLNDVGPDLGSVDARHARTGTEPLIIDPSDGVQVRVDTPNGSAPAGLRLELIDPGTSSADATIGAAPPASSAAAAAPQPTIVTRAQWGADERLRNGFAGYSDTIKVGFVHHTVSSNSYTGTAGAAATIRGIYAYDTNGLGWSDIAYNFLVDKYGTIYEGRAGGIAKAVIGAHTAGFNNQSFAVAALGCFDTSCSGGLHPPAAMVTSIARVMAWKLGLFWRDPAGTGTLTSSGITGTNLHHPAGQLVTTPTISGHRDVDATACPGNLLYPMLPSIRAQAVQFLGAGLVNPSLGTTSGAYGTAGPSIRSGVMTAQTWSGSVADICRGGTVATLPSGSATPAVPISTAWDGQTTGGNWPRPGPYRLTLTSSASTGPPGTGTAVPWSATYTVNGPPPAAAVPGSAITGDGGFVAVRPFRLLDTRNGVYANGPGGRVDLQVLGRGGVPSTGVTSAYLTVTVTCPTAGSFVTVYASGTALPLASNQNFGPGQTRSALVAAPVGADGDISIYNSAGTTQIVADVVGYGAASGGADLTAVPLTRAYTTVGSAQGKLRTNESRTVTLPAMGGIAPADITGIVANLVAATPSAGGWLDVYPGGASWPGTSALSYPASITTDTSVVVGVSNGKVVLRNGGLPVDMALDVVGVYTAHSAKAGSRYTAVSSYRALDTRVGGGYLPAGYIRAVTVTGASGVPVGAKAVLVNLTGIAPSASTTLMAWADPGAAPGTGVTVPPGALLRIAAGDVRANLAVVPVGANGRIMLRSVASATQAVVDVLGYYR